MIKDRFLPNGIVHSVKVDNGVVVREWSWLRNGQGGTAAPLDYLGKPDTELRGFRKRPSDYDVSHPGAGT